jgi:AAA domain/Bifunctional DNA primase/polymerase, N-terminal
MTAQRQLDAAHRYRERGLSVIPIRGDGSKAAACRWAEYQREPPDDAQLARWFGNGETRGLALIAGEVSGNLLVIDFECIELFDQWLTLARPILAEAGIDPETLPLVETPRPGRHVYLRTAEPPPGNDKLALDHDSKTTLIETRGEGGYVIAPGSPGCCHPTGREYRFVRQGWIAGTVSPRIGLDHLDALLNCCRALDRSRRPEPSPKREPSVNGDGSRPGDEFNRRADWGVLLREAGGTLVSQSGDVQLWRRPGKECGMSGTVGHHRTANGVPLLIVFSSNWSPFEQTTKTNPRGYTPFEAYALLKHRGDFTAAAEELARQGYGEARRSQKSSSGNAGAENQSSSEPVWPAPKKASEVAKNAPVVEWIWQGILAAGHITLVSALMKAGKSTMLSLLLNAFEHGSKFLGAETRICKVLYITEESETIWRDRIRELKIADHVSLIDTPFMVRPSAVEWVSFIDHVLACHAREPFELVVIDTLSNLGPITNENDAAEVVAALMPLRKVTKAGIAVLLVHHVGKSEQGEGKSARGSTGFGGFVDIMIEMKRFKPNDTKDRSRVLTGWGRFRDVPEELVVKLADDGLGYTVEGDRREARERDLDTALRSMLPTGEPGWAWEEIRDNWPGETSPRKQDVLKALKRGTCFRSTGEGKRGSPKCYFRVLNC